MKRGSAARAVSMMFALTSAGCSGGSTQVQILVYEQERAAYRVGEPIAENAPLAGSPAPAQLVVEPPLPAGLALDPVSGAIHGTPLAEAEWTTHVIASSAPTSPASTEVRIRVGPALPAAIESLAPGFAAAVVAEGVSIPVKLALAPDGRLFFNELASGAVRIIDPLLAWQPAPFATVSIETGGHRGLLGLALAPDFAASGHVYVMATVPADGTLPARARVLRYTDSFGTGIDETVIVDGLPVAEIDNGGELCFDASGMLLVSVGDAQDPALAQDPSSLAGKVLRYTPDGGIPADNPDPASPVWCLGLRNTFALALHPTTGGLFGADNGPDQDDELNFLVPGRNFGWGYEGEGLGADAGYAVRVWRDVIVPTALEFHAGAGAWSAFAGELFLARYADGAVHRITLFGSQATDFHLEHDFLRFREQGLDGKPLDLAQAPEGSLYVSTFTGIYRIDSLAE